MMSVLFFLSTFFLLSASTSLSPALYHPDHLEERENDVEPTNFYSDQINSPLFINGYSQFHEEIALKRVELEPNFIGGTGVTSWQRLRLGNGFYLLGITEGKQLNVVKIYRKHGDLLQGHVQGMEFDKNITTATMFKIRSKGADEGLILVVLPPPDNGIMWYRINDMKIEALWYWKKDNEVRDIVQFTVGNSNRLLIIEKSEETLFASVHGFDLNRKIPHYWLLESLPLRDSSTSPVVNVLPDGRVYFSIVHEETRSVRVFEHQSVCGGFFQERFSLTDMGAKSVRGFNDEKDSYIVVVGVDTTLFKLPRQREQPIAGEAHFGNLEDVMIVPVGTTRKDVVALGKRPGGAVSVFSRNARGWREISSPTCQLPEKKVQDISACFGGENWKGAVFLELGDIPSILFPNKDKSELFYLFFSLVLAEDRLQSNFNWMYALGDELKLGWDEFEKALNGLQRSEKKRNDDEFPVGEICAIQKRLNEIIRLLVDAKLRVNTIDCTQASNLTERAKNIVQAPSLNKDNANYRKNVRTYDEETVHVNKITPELHTTDKEGLDSLDRQAAEIYANTPIVRITGIAEIP